MFTLKIIIFISIPVAWWFFNLIDQNYDAYSEQFRIWIGPKLRIEIKGITTMPISSIWKCFLSPHVDLDFQLNSIFVSVRRVCVCVCGPPFNCNRKKASRSNIDLFQLTFQQKRSTWSENDPLLYWPASIQRKKAYCAFDMHDFSFIDCASGQRQISVCSYFKKRYLVLVVKFYFWQTVFLCVTVCPFDVIRFCVFFSFFCGVCHGGSDHTLWRELSEWERERAKNTPNVSSRRTLPTGYLTKLMDTYEARSIAHVSGAQPLLLPHTQNSGYILIIDINNIINLWLGAQTANQPLGASMMQLTSKSSWNMHRWCFESVQFELDIFDFLSKCVKLKSKLSNFKWNPFSINLFCLSSFQKCFVYSYHIFKHLEKF